MSRSLSRLEAIMKVTLGEIDAKGIRKGNEKVVRAVKAPQDGFGPRYLLEGEGEKEFLRMNSNSYLGLSLMKETIESEEKASQAFGAGPGAVRFISGTFTSHVELEKKLAAFHSREAAIIFSSAYAAVMGTLPQLITDDTVVISDALNHNCIINAIRLSRPKEKSVYTHLDMNALEKSLADSTGRARRTIVVTDGIFSMRGDHAPLDAIGEICSRHNGNYEEGVITVVDDSHGVGAFGKTGRGTEEYTGGRADILIGTLGKAFGVNGGYVVSSKTVIDYLREKSPFYIYSNPITPSEAEAALTSIKILDGQEGMRLLEKLKGLTVRLKEGIKKAGFETLPGEHPVVPLMLRDTEKTKKLVVWLFENGVLAAGLNFPVVPKGDEEIRFQVSADHTEKDIDFLINLLEKFRG